MKELKIILIAVLFFVLGSGTSVYFVSNVKANKSKNKLILDRKKIEIDDSGLQGVNAFNTSVYENEIIGKVWPDYHDKLTAIIEDGLKKEGLHIVHKLSDAIPDFISLAINVVRDEPSRTIAGSIELYLNGVFIDYEGKRLVSANRWNKTQAFMIKETEAPQYIEKVTQSMMNDFINDYRKANPKKEGAVSSGAASQ